MLIIKKREKSEKAEPATFPVTIQGKEVTLTVRPYDQEEIAKILKKYTRYVVELHPKTKQPVRIPFRSPDDETKIGEDVIDYLLADFSGIGESETCPLEVTRENKLIVAVQEVGKNDDGEVIHVSDIIQEKAKELSAIVKREEKAVEKN